MLARCAKIHSWFKPRRISTNSRRNAKSSVEFNPSPLSAPDSYLKSGMKLVLMVAIPRAWITRRFFYVKRKHPSASKARLLVRLLMKLLKRYEQLKRNWLWKRIKFLQHFAQLPMPEKALRAKRVISMDFAPVSMQPTPKSLDSQQHAQRLRLAFTDLEQSLHLSKQRLPG